MVLDEIDTCITVSCDADVIEVFYLPQNFLKL